MKIESKYNIGDKVWFPKSHKYFEGTITDLQGWEKDRGFLYVVIHTEDELCLTEYMYEQDLCEYDNTEKIINKLFVKCC